MNKKIISSLILASVITVGINPAITAKANTNINTSNYKAETVSVEENAVSENPLERTAYNWTVKNLSAGRYGTTQIVGPMSQGQFNTEGLFSNRTFKISWSGATSGANFDVKFVGQDQGNKGKVTLVTCSGSSGSKSLTVPYEARGVFKAYVVNNNSSSLSISSLTLDSR